MNKIGDQSLANENRRLSNLYKMKLVENLEFLFKFSLV